MRSTKQYFKSQVKEVLNIFAMFTDNLKFHSKKHISRKCKDKKQIKSSDNDNKLELVISVSQTWLE